MMSHVVELVIVDVGESPMVEVSEVLGMLVVGTTKDYPFLLVRFG
jgi:hypothetical protein